MGSHLHGSRHERQGSLFQNNIREREGVSQRLPNGSRRFNACRSGGHLNKTSHGSCQSIGVREACPPPVVAVDRSTEKPTFEAGLAPLRTAPPECANTQAEDVLEYSYEASNPLC